MRRCLSCHERYDDRRRVCPKDGEALITEGKATPDTGRILDFKYKLGNLIGEGGMGQVYEARSLDTGDPVAIKLLKARLVDKKARRRFELEAEAMAALRHPGAVKIIEFQHTPDGLTYMVMERLYGPTFGDLRRAGKFASPERVVELMKEASEVVGAAHHMGIVHRDLKPSNLILHRDSPEHAQVKVLDFGIAKFLDRAGAGLTGSGELVGTLLYMAPEQGSGLPVTPATDVYSLGTILFEALAGRLPFDARNSAELIALRMSAPVPALSSFRHDISDELDDLVARCLSKKSENRYPDAMSLARALGEVRAARPREDTLSSTKTLRINPSLWVGSMLDGRYELHEWLAPGRFRSHVYRATHLLTGANVAVRVWRTGKGAIRDLLIEAFRNEARAMGVRHPNLITILDLAFNDDCVYVVTEYVEGGSLRELLHSRSRLPTALAARLIRGAAEALGALHSRGIVSGGLSPDTMRLTGPTDQPEQLLLSPLGLTNLRQVDALLDPSESAEGDRVRDYMAPEQLAGSVPDIRSDTYSLGLVLLEMLGGQPRLLGEAAGGPGSSVLPEAGASGPVSRMSGARGGRRSRARGREDPESVSPAASQSSLRTLPVSDSTTGTLPSASGSGSSGLFREGAGKGGQAFPTNLPAPWRAFLLRAVDNNPSARFQSSIEFLAGLPAE